jgi:predicted nucleotidyltransferase
MDKGRTLFDLIGFRLDLEDLLHIPVEVVTTNSLLYIRDRVLTEAQSL